MVTTKLVVLTMFVTTNGEATTLVLPFDVAVVVRTVLVTTTNCSATTDAVLVSAGRSVTVCERTGDIIPHPERITPMTAEKRAKMNAT